jgi:hypothetical protein
MHPSAPPPPAQMVVENLLIPEGYKVEQVRVTKPAHGTRHAWNADWGCAWAHAERACLGRDMAAALARLLPSRP